MRLVPFTGEITRPAIEDLLTQLRNSNAPDGVFVDSPGGTFEFFSVVGPAIQRRGIITLAGNVRSAAVILFLLGGKRQALPDSTFFFHEVRSFVMGSQILISDIEEVLKIGEMMRAEDRESFEHWLRQMRMAEAWFMDFLARKTDLRPAVFLDLMRNEAMLTADEAVRYGITHGIVPVRNPEQFLM